MQRGLWLLSVLTACASAQRSSVVGDLPADCIGSPMQPIPFVSEDWLHLAGTFRLTTVQTSHGGSPDVWRRTLALRIADSATRYAPRISINFKREPGDRPVVGSATPVVPAGNLEQVEYEGGSLYVGCRYFQCTDASPWVYHVEWRTADGFGGTWRDFQTGIVRAVDARRRPLPDPAGHFCAARVP